MLGAQTGRLGARETFARAYQELSPTGEEVKAVHVRLAAVLDAIFPVLEANGFSPSETLAAVLSYVVKCMGETKMEDDIDAVMFEALSVASAASLVAVTDLIVTNLREKSNE